jgi:hypothetical protein
MDGAARDKLCTECLEVVKRFASVALESADEGAFQKSGTLRDIVKRINEVLAKIDSAD